MLNTTSRLCHILDEIVIYRTCDFREYNHTWTCSKRVTVTKSQVFKSHPTTTLYLKKESALFSISSISPVNRWIHRPEGLSSCEWKGALKMTANACLVRAVSGRSQDTNHCRHCGNEIETLGEPVPMAICLQTPGITKYAPWSLKSSERGNSMFFEEVPGMSETGSQRRVDIIDVQPDSSPAIIIYPTIRWEINGDQPISVHKGKCRIYEPTIQYYITKYHPTSIEVVGLMIGARGTIPDFFVKFCRRFKIHNAFIKKSSPLYT